MQSSRKDFKPSSNLPSFQRTKFSVIQTYTSSPRKCCKCCIQFKPKEITLKTFKQKKTKFYHLPCFTPKFHQFIYKSDLHIKLDQASKPTFSNWLQNWNSNFPKILLLQSESFRISSLKKVQSNRTRGLLEIFKFLESQDIKTLALVSKEFNQVLSEPELWKYLLERDFDCFDERREYREKYIYLTLSFCSICNKLPDNGQFFICPIFEQVTCIDCHMGESRSLVSSKAIEEILGDKYQSQFLKYALNEKGQKVTYLFMAKFLIESELEFICGRILELIGDDAEFDKVKKVISRVRNGSIRIEVMKNGKISLNYESIGNKYINFVSKLCEILSGNYEIPTLEELRIWSFTMIQIKNNSIF